MRKKKQEEQALRERAAMPYVLGGLSCVGAVLAANWVGELRSAWHQSKKERNPSVHLDARTEIDRPSL
jgi:hypothetical protein